MGWDKKKVCSHCGYPWEDNPTCCQKAIEEWNPDNKQCWLRKEETK